MTKLFPDDIANLRLLGYIVTSKEGQTFVESDEFLVEEDFGRWFLFKNTGLDYKYYDEFATVYQAIDYAKKVLK